MIATIRFNLPEEESDHRLAVNAGRVASALWDYDQKLRGWLKYGHEFATADFALNAARNELHRQLSERGVSMDDMT